MRIKDSLVVESVLTEVLMGTFQKILWNKTGFISLLLVLLVFYYHSEILTELLLYNLFMLCTFVYWYACIYLLLK